MIFALIALGIFRAIEGAVPGTRPLLWDSPVATRRVGPPWAMPNECYIDEGYDRYQSVTWHGGNRYSSIRKRGGGRRAFRSRGTIE